MEKVHVQISMFQRLKGGFMFINRVEWKTMLKWALVPLIVVLSVHAARLTNSKLRAKEVRAGGPIPYTVILRETVFDASNGSFTSGIETTKAIRSDGSYVKRRKYDNTNDPKMKSLIQKERTIRFASGVLIDTNDLTHTKSTIVSKESPASWQNDPNSKCLNSFAGTSMSGAPQVVSEEMVAGYRTAKIVRANATWWYALDFGCAPVKVRMDWGQRGFSEKNLVSLSSGEPDPALFDVPANFRESPPSARMPRPGVTLQHQDIELFRKLDAAYYKNRAQ
jgi:hypothetical protein